jgi:hypothetical protein
MIRVSARISILFFVSLALGCMQSVPEGDREVSIIDLGDRFTANEREVLSFSESGMFERVFEFEMIKVNHEDDSKFIRAVYHLPDDIKQGHQDWSDQRNVRSYFRGAIMQMNSSKFDSIISKARGLSMSFDATKDQNGCLDGTTFRLLVDGKFYKWSCGADVRHLELFSKYLLDSVIRKGDTAPSLYYKDRDGQFIEIAN